MQDLSEKTKVINDKDEIINTIKSQNYAVLVHVKNVPKKGNGQFMDVYLAIGNEDNIMINKEIFIHLRPY